MRYRAVAVDIDGTLTDDDLILDCDAVNALRSLKSMGLEVILCSGNVLPIAYALSFYLGLRGPIVAENGGVIYHDRKIEVIADPGAALKAYEYLRTRANVRRLFTDRWRESEVGIYQDIPVGTVRDILRDFDVLVESSGFAIHIMAGRITKMDGIRRIAEIIGIKTDEIIAVGDGDNDAEMLKGCGYGICPANASENAKRSADHVTSLGNGSGFLEAVEHIKEMITK